jgi:toxin-antitoxin system PIN domain toxin
LIAVDTNILIYAHRKESPHNELAHQRVVELGQAGTLWAIPWPCIHEFLAVTTNRRVFDPPTPPAEAVDQIDAWLESPSLVLLAESERHWSELRALVAAGHVTGGRLHDARIAALCRQHGVRELWSADRDFSRFSGLRVVNPLLGYTSGS